MPVTTAPAVATLPPAPVRGQAGFSDAVGLFLEALPDFGDQVDASGQATQANAEYVETVATEFAAAILVAQDAAGFVATSTSTLTVGAGTKTIHFTTAKPNFDVNDEVWIVQRSDATIKMRGTLATMDAGNDDITVTVASGGVYGSGSYSSWLIMSGAFIGSGATAADMWAGETDAAAASPKSFADAAAPVTIAYASTLVVNMNEGRYRRMSTAASFTLGIPINAKAGQSFILDILNTAGSVVLATNAAWDRKNGLLGILNPDNAARNKIICIIDEVDGSGNMTRGTYDVQPGLA